MLMYFQTSQKVENYQESSGQPGKEQTTTTCTVVQTNHSLLNMENY